MSDVSYDPRPVFYRAAAVLWLLAFVFALMPFDAYEDESFLLAFLCAAGSSLFVLAAAPMGGLLGVLKSPVIFIAGAFWVLAGLSVVLSDIRFVSFIYFCFFSVFPLSFFITVLQRDVSVFVRYTGLGLTAVMAALGAAALVQYYFMPDMMVNGLVRWPLANPNALAGLFSLSFFAALGLMLAGQTKIHSNLGLALALLFLLAIFTTGSRGAFCGLVIAFVLFGVFARSFFKQHWRCLGLLVLGGVIGFLVFTFAPMHHTQGPLDVLENSVAAKHPFLWGRPSIWASSWEIFQQHWLSGTGIGTFFLYYPAFRLSGDPSATLMAHSDPIQFAVELGVLGPLLFYAFIVFVCLRTIKAVRILDSNDPRRVLILAVFFAMAAMVMHAHVTFHFHVLPMLMMSGLLTGIWFVQTSLILNTDPKDDNVAHSHPVLRWAFALPLILLCGVFAQYQASEILVNRSHDLITAGELEDGIDDINQAGRLSSNMNARALIAASNITIGTVQLNAPFMPNEELNTLYQQADAMLVEAGQSNALLPQVPYYRAELLSYVQPFMQPLPTDVPAVDEMLAQAIALDPMHISSRRMLATRLLRAGKKQEALDLLEGGLMWRYGRQNPKSYFLMTYNLAKDLGDTRVVTLVEDKMEQHKMEPE